MGLGSGLVRNSKIYRIWRSQLNSRGLYLSAQMELDDVLGIGLKKLRLLDSLILTGVLYDGGGVGGVPPAH